VWNTHQIEGHSQSPLGILATTSTRPYWSENLPAVVRRAERTGLMIVPFVELLIMTHCLSAGEVQVPAAVKFKVEPLNICAAVKFVVSSVSVGTI
jgi:hypothetical protein